MLCFDGDLKGTVHTNNENLVISVHLHADGESAEVSSSAYNFWSLTA